MKHSLLALVLSSVLFTLSSAYAGSSWLVELLASPGGRYLFTELGLGEAAGRVGTHRLFGMKHDPMDVLVSSTTERYLAKRPDDAWIFSSAERDGLPSVLQYLSRTQRNTLRQAFLEARQEFHWIPEMPANSYSANRAVFADGRGTPQRQWLDNANFVPGNDRATLNTVMESVRAARRAGTPGTVVIHLESAALDPQAAMAAALWGREGWLANPASFEFPIARDALRGLRYARLSPDPAQLYRAAGLDPQGGHFEEFREFVAKLFADDSFIAKYSIARPGFVDYVGKLRKLGAEVVLYSSTPALTGGQGTAQALKRIGLGDSSGVRLVMTPSYARPVEYRVQAILRFAREGTTNVVAIFDHEAVSLLAAQRILPETKLVFVNTEMSNVPEQAGRGLHLLESWLLKPLAL